MPFFFIRDYSKEKYKEKYLVLEPQECNSSMREETPQINPYKNAYSHKIDFIIQSCLHLENISMN